MKLETQKSVLNLWLHTHSSHILDQRSNHQTNEDLSFLALVLFLLKRTAKNVLVILFFPVIVLSSLDAYLDKISDNRRFLVHKE